jgi:hypothetical protein
MAHSEEVGENFSVNRQLFEFIRNYLLVLGATCKARNTSKNISRQGGSPGPPVAAARAPAPPSFAEVWQQKNIFDFCRIFWNTIIGEDF